MEIGSKPETNYAVVKYSCCVPIYGQELRSHILYIKIGSRWCAILLRRPRCPPYSDAISAQSHTAAWHHSRTFLHMRSPPTYVAVVPSCAKPDILSLSFFTSAALLR